MFDIDINFSQFRLQLISVLIIVRIKNVTCIVFLKNGLYYRLQTIIPFSRKNVVSKMTLKNGKISSFLRLANLREFRPRNPMSGNQISIALP